MMGAQSSAIKRIEDPPMVKEEFYTHAMTDGISCKFGLMDTTGMEELTDLLEERISRADAFVLI